MLRQSMEFAAFRPGGPTDPKRYRGALAASPTNESRNIARHARATTETVYAKNPPYSVPRFPRIPPRPQRHNLSRALSSSHTPGGVVLGAMGGRRESLPCDAIPHAAPEPLSTAGM